MGVWLLVIGFHILNWLHFFSLCSLLMVTVFHIVSVCEGSIIAEKNSWNRGKWWNGLRWETVPKLKVCVSDFMFRRRFLWSWLKLWESSWEQGLSVNARSRQFSFRNKEDYTQPLFSSNTALWFILLTKRKIRLKAACSADISSSPSMFFLLCWELTRSGYSYDCQAEHAGSSPFWYCIVCTFSNL